MTRATPLTDARWDNDVLAADGIVIVGFHASWSSPCRAFDATIDELADDLRGSAKVLALDVEENPESARRYDVSSLPTLLVFRGGRLIGRIVGSRSRERLRLALARYVD